MAVMNVCEESHGINLVARLHEVKLNEVGRSDSVAPTLAKGAPPLYDNGRNERFRLPKRRLSRREPIEMKIAVIGAGISGLTAAYRLSRQHDVELFEANDYLGGHTNTVDVELEGEHHAIDTGFVVFNDRTYPSFVAMLDEFGVKSRPAPMSFSLRCDRTGLEYNGSSLSGLFAQRRNLFRPRFWRMLRDILRFNREAPRRRHLVDIGRARMSK